jgi:hypothetical protein
MIHAIPGMGADHRMFPAAWDALPEFVAHDWPRHRGERTLAEVASSLCREYEADLLLDGGHLVSMTHAEACAGFIQSTMSSNPPSCGHR